MTRDEYSLIREDVARLREEVMSRVRTVRKIKAFFASPLCSASFAVVFISCTTIFVSLRDIVHNVMLQTEWGERFFYTYSSLLHTKVMVQILALLASACCLILFLKVLMKLKAPVYFVGKFLHARLPVRIFRA